MNDRYYVTDTDLSERFPLYTRANVGEVFPDPVTPLTSTTLLFESELGWRDAWVRMGAFRPDEFPDGKYAQLGVVGGYCYLNASIIRLFGERAPGLSWRDMDEQFFGAQPGIPDYVEAPGDVDPEAEAKIGETFGWVLSLSSVDDLDDLTKDREDTKARRAARPDYSAMSLQELWDAARELNTYQRDLFAHHLFATYMATVPVGIISAVATAVERPDLIMPIIAGIGQVDSAEPSHAMWDLSRLIRTNTTLTSAFDAGVAGLIDRLAASDDAVVAQFRDGFEAFLFEFGSRGPNEWETRSPSWETEPELALAAIERMRLVADDLSPANQHAVRASDRAAASAELLAMVEADPETHGQLNAAITSSAAWLPGRERTKTNNIRNVHENRMPLRELGRRIVELGGFDEIEDFGMVMGDEWPALLADPTSMLETVRSRRDEYNELCRHEAQFIFVGAPEDPATWPLIGANAGPQLGPGDTLTGLPGCPGAAEGRARVVLDSHDPSALEPGDILIAPITDPSWTPLFVPSAAVVVDVGAALSHAIIVSRELGIPCVVSATGATQTIPDGAQISVNGSTGEVTIIELP